jgi:8-oxo-dGTP pyrophosphatase MutT (NUDIX family)
MDALRGGGVGTDGAGTGNGEAPVRLQFAALPQRVKDGAVEVLLILSRETRRWVIPKGWPMRGRKPHRVAEIEAFQEAGVVGRVGKAEIGRYRYPKRLADGSVVTCEVAVFPLAVARRRKRWPERAERGKGRWMSPGKAALAVQEPGLASIIGQVSQRCD